MSEINYIAAAYIGLSSEDCDNEILKKESDSVSNQRAVIKNYIKNNNELSAADYMEFVDDGYSGTNFARVR